MTSDPISDMLTRIRNALKAELPVVELPGSKIKGEILRVMKAEGFISDYTLTNGVPRLLSIELKYGRDAVPAIRGLRRESRPGLRKFCNSKEIPQVLGGMGIVILSTSSGILSGKEARERRLGGELLCSIW